MPAPALRRILLFVTYRRVLLCVSEAPAGPRATAPGSTEVTAASGISARYGSARIARGVLVSPIPPFRLHWNIAASASATAAVACIPTWETDFRADLPKIDVPMLVIRAMTTRSRPTPRPANGCPA